MYINRKASYIAAGKAAHKNIRPTIGPLDAADTKCVVYTKCFHSAEQIVSCFVGFDVEIEYQNDLQVISIPLPTAVVCEYLSRLHPASPVRTRHSA